MRALVVDDEAPARRRLVRMLSEIPGVTTVGQLDDGDAVLRALETVSADVIFLDVRMPGLDGLTLAQRYASLPAIVFVTAYDQYAVEAFNVDAVDYLLKPVRPERLLATIERVRKHSAKQQDVDSSLARPSTRIDRALASSRAGEKPALPRVISSSRGLIKLFDAREVTRFWAADKYTLFRADGAEQMTEEPLGALEERLAPHGFLRVHRAELVRIDAVRALRAETGCHELSLSDGQVARVSRRVLGTIKDALGLG